MTAQPKRRASLCVATMVLILLPSVVPPNCSALAADNPFASPAKDAPYAAFIAEAAQRFELPTAWIRAVMRAESDGDPRALSPKGAVGLMQIMPDTWAEIRIRYRLGGDPYDPHDNIVAGAAYIRELCDRYGSPGWIAAYNAGSSRYEASLKGRPLPAETRAYLDAIAPNLDGTGIADNTAIAPSDALLWTRAPLFMAWSERTRDTDSLQNERSLTDAPVTTTVRDVSAIVPQSGGLFVARAGTGQQP